MKILLHLAASDGLMVHTNLWACVRRVDPQVEAGAARQTQHVLQHMAAEVLHAALQQEVAQKGVFLRGVLAEIHKALHVEASAHILQVLMARREGRRERVGTEKERWRVVSLKKVNCDLS